jgi:hypothetical protein
MGKPLDKLGLHRKVGDPYIVIQSFSIAIKQIGGGGTYASIGARIWYIYRC